MKNNSHVLQFVFFLLFTYGLMGQEMNTLTKPEKIHSVFVKTQFAQYKDQFNYGLVFSGVNLDLGYAFQKKSERRIISYKGELAAGINFNKGPGLVVRLKPVDFFYGFSINDKPVTIGPYFSANYQWQLYPEIQSGHMFWFSTWEIGPQIIVKVSHHSNRITLIFSNSLLGFTSRPEPGTESTYYSLKLIDFIKNGHQNMKFGSFNNFNHTDLQLGFQNNKWKRLSLFYSFEYFGYYQDPKLGIIYHSINLNFKLGKNHEN